MRPESNKTKRTSGYTVKKVEPTNKLKVAYSLFSSNGMFISGPYRTASKAWKEADRLAPDNSKYRVN